MVPLGITYDSVKPSPFTLGGFPIRLGITQEIERVIVYYPNFGDGRAKPPVPTRQRPILTS